MDIRHDIQLSDVPQFQHNIDATDPAVIAFGLDLRRLRNFRYTLFGKA